MTAEPLSRDSVVFLLVDHQTGVFERVVKAPPRDQVEANGTLLPALEVCGVAPALHAHRDGYQVVFVADACGSATAIGHDISLRRMEQAGITLTTTASVSAELAGDYPRHSQIMRGG